MRKYSSLLSKYCVCLLISSWSFWLFILCLACSYLSAMHQATIKPYDSIHLYTCLTVLSNASFGYIAGYIFYILSDFIPKSKSKFQALQKILYAEYEILSSSLVLEFYKLGETDSESNQDVVDQKQKFVISLCENNPYEQCKDEAIRNMVYWKISNNYIHFTTIYRKSSSVYFDLLLGSQSKYLSYNEIESIAKLKRCLFMEYAEYKDECFSAKLFQINEAFDDYYNCKSLIINHLKTQSDYCVDKELSQKIQGITFLA